jgi:choline dehydrogenase-like flavoprotein
MSKAYDYIIVGSGPAGCVLAARLTEDPNVSVLLVEAGGQDKSFLFHWPAGFAKMTKGIASWGWSTVPQRHMQDRVFWYTQAKVIGGGSTINAQIYTRGNALDYDAWRDEAGCEGWGYRDVLPYFKRAEGNERFGDDYHGTDGPLGVSMPRGALPICDAFIQAAQQAGIPYNPDFNGRYQRGIGYYQLTQRNTRRSSAAVAFLRPAQSRANLTVMHDVEVRRIVLEKGRAKGIEINQETALAYLECTREVLVTAGAIGSPRLLLLSGIGPAGELEAAGVNVVHDLPGVGANLQDHVDICILCECTGDHSYDSLQKPHRSVLAGLQYILFKSGPVVSSLFETGGFWYADPAARSPDIQFHFGQGSGIEKGIVKLDNPGVTLNTAVMRPKSRGTVKLKSADPREAPLIDPNYWAEPYDREMSFRGLELGREIMAQPALAPFIKREALPGPHTAADPKALFDYACRMAKTDHHPVGTCRMGHDSMAVVGTDLKVHGLDGLRVCDSSIMPLINSSNTNAPTIMIGEKASDLVRNLPPLPPAVFSWERNDYARFAEA